MDQNLAGIMYPCYSYLSFIKTNNTNYTSEQNKGMFGSFSPNYFTYGYSHDWCCSESYVRVSG